MLGSNLGLKTNCIRIKSLSAKLCWFDKPSIQRKEKSVSSQELLGKNVGENWIVAFSSEMF